MPEFGEAYSEILQNASKQELSRIHVRNKMQVHNPGDLTAGPKPQMIQLICCP